MDTDSLPVQTELLRKRSAWLSFLIILTFIMVGIDFIVVFATAIGGWFSAFLSRIPIMDTMITEDSSGRWFFLLIKFIVLALLLTGAVYMWKLKRRGFWFYLTAQLLLLLIPFIFLLNLGIGYLLVRLLVNTIFSLFFVLLFLPQLKNMN